MSTNIEHLFELCKEQPFNIEKIKNYIIDNKMNSEQVTRVAIMLCNYGFCSYSDYLYENEKEPSPGDLITYNWEELFDIQLGVYHHKWQQDKAFRYWLVLVGFGGTINNGRLPIEMCNGFKADIFKEFEKFDYNIRWGKKDFDLEIFDKETGTVVGIA